MPNQIESSYCSCCRDLFTGKTGESHLCQQCIETKPFFRLARSVLELNEELLTAIHAFKYKGHVHLTRPLGRLLAVGYERYYKDTPLDMIISIPAPLHRQKAYGRGFNQSYLLVTEMAKHTNLPSGMLNPFGFQRVKNTVSQAWLTRKERWKNMQGALAKKMDVTGKRILVIDDILTTGATVNMCANVLLKNKAESVGVLTLARAPL